MPLTWDVSKIENFQELTTLFVAADGRGYSCSEVKDSKLPNTETLDGIPVTSKWHPLTESMVFMMWFTGIGELTEENVEEFLFRSRLYDRLFGPTFLHPDRKDYSFTRAEIKAHVGMYINSPTERFSTWSKRMLDNFRSDIRNFH
jgi:hypothetical protein